VDARALRAGARLGGSCLEIACAVPGCPPLETVVGFSIAEQRHQFRVFKPLEQVGSDDLPPAWFKGALAVAGELDCDCC